MIETPQNNDDSENNRKLEKTKQLVTNIFRKISDNPAIPNMAKNILLELNDTYLKMALETPNLFAFESHQSRIFLDIACQVSMDWNVVDGNKSSYLRKLQNIVNTIKTNGTYNNKNFIKYQKDLENALNKIKKRIVIREKRKQEKLLGQQKISEAQSETALIIANKMKGIDRIPNYIAKILNEEWSNVLVLLHIRSGPKSSTYQSKIKFIDRLLSIIQNSQSKDSVKQTVKSIINQYNQGLELIAFNKQEINDKTNGLNAYLSQFNQSQISNQPKVKKNIVDSSKPSTHDTTASQVNSENLDINVIKNKNNTKEKRDNIARQAQPKKNNQVDTSLKKNDDVSKNPVKTSRQKQEAPVKKILKKTQINKTKRPVSKDYSKIVESIKKGTWFELYSTNGGLIKAKLSWVSPITGNHLFVDLQGLKIANKSKSELIQGLKDSSIKIIND